MNAKSKSKEHSLLSWETVQPKEISYLWEGWLPFGKISLIVGDAGCGKTTLALDIAARLTTGREMPFSNAPPIIGNVLYQSHEDSISDTLLPRCITAGADLRRLKSIDATGLNIDEDCDIIEEYIRQTEARYMVWDPFQSFLGKNADMCRITDIRRLLTNLGGVAARTNCAIIIIAHLAKSRGGSDLHRVFGSVDITATARSVLRVSADENNPDTRIISHIKSSISRPCPPIAFQIMDNAPILYMSEYDGDGWLDEVEEMPDNHDKRDLATKIICSILQDSPIEGKEVYRICEEAGISSRTVERVKKELNIGTNRDGNKRFWYLQ